MVPPAAHPWCREQAGNPVPDGAAGRPRQD